MTHGKGGGGQRGRRHRGVSDERHDDERPGGDGSVAASQQRADDVTGRLARVERKVKWPC